MYLISAYFDDALSKQLGRLIHTVAKQTGNTFMLDHEVPPHLTISAFEMRQPEDLVEAFRTLSHLPKGKVEFVSIGQFFPYVMYVTPVLNAYLSKLQESTFEMLSYRDDVLG